MHLKYDVMTTFVFSDVFLMKKAGFHLIPFKRVDYHNVMNSRSAQSFFFFFLPHVKIIHSVGPTGQCHWIAKA